MTLKDLQFFNDKTILDEKTEGDVVYVDTGENQYRVAFYEKPFLPLLESKKKWFDRLREINPRIAGYDEIGTTTALSYAVKEVFPDVKYDLTREEQFEKGVEFGQFLRKFHRENLREDSDFWSTVYHYKINMVDHEYGLGRYRGPKDYMVLDFIRNQKYLLDHRPTTNILYLRSFHDVHISEDGRFEFDLFNQSYVADPYFEFRNININHYKIEYFIVGMLKGYFGRLPRNFLKILALYTLVEFWGDSFVEKRPYESVVRLKTEELVEEYDNFSTPMPRWIKEVRDEI